MEINSDMIRLVFDGFELRYHRSLSGMVGWSVMRDGKFDIPFGSWEAAWDSLTTGERSRCISFSNQLR